MRHCGFVWSVFCICIPSFDSLWLTLVFIFTQVGWLHLTVLILATECFVLWFFFHFIIRWLYAFNVWADCEWDGEMLRENKEGKRNWSVSRTNGFEEVNEWWNGWMLILWMFYESRHLWASDQYQQHRYGGSYLRKPCHRIRTLRIDSYEMLC